SWMIRTGHTSFDNCQGPTVPRPGRPPTYDYLWDGGTQAEITGVTGHTFGGKCLSGDSTGLTFRGRFCYTTRSVRGDAVLVHGSSLGDQGHRHGGARPHGPRDPVLPGERWLDRSGGRRGAERQRRVSRPAGRRWLDPDWP